MHSEQCLKNAIVAFTAESVIYVHVKRYCVGYDTPLLVQICFVLLPLSPKLHWSYYPSLLNYIGPETPLLNYICPTTPLLNYICPKTPLLNYICPTTPLLN